MGLPSYITVILLAYDTTASFPNFNNRWSAMLLTMGLQRNLVLWLVLCGAVLTSGAPKDCVYQTRAQIIAFLALRSGENCDRVVLSGLQQKAALDYANDQLNSANPSGPRIEVQVLDTCSTSEQAVNAALRGLVQAQQGCKAPMFLGFLGPDDHEALRAVAKVISVFHLPHISVQGIRSYSQLGTFEIQTVDPTITSRGLTMLLDEIHWKSFYLTFTPDASSKEAANAILENRNFCVSQSTLPIPSSSAKNDYVAYNRLLHSLQKAQNPRVVMIIDRPEAAMDLLQHLESVVFKTQFIIYVKSVGMLPWKMPEDVARRVLILQETSNSNILPENFKEVLESSELWPEYLAQTQCDGSCLENEIVREPTTTNMAYAVYLLHEALQSGLLLKCRSRDIICPQLFSMPPQEWRELLESTTFGYKVPDTAEHLKLRFHTFLSHYVNVFASEEGKNFEDVGFISEGESLALKKRSSLPTIALSHEEQCGGNLTALLSTPSPVEPALPSARPTQSMPVLIDIFGIDVNLANFGYYELVGIITGVIFGLIVIIVVMICLVYRCFRVKANKTFSSPSTGSDAGSPPRKRKFERPRLFKSSVRSVHTVRE